MKLPEELSASIRVGASPLAMMGDQSQSKRGKGWNRNTVLPRFRWQWRRPSGLVFSPAGAEDSRTGRDPWGRHNRPWPTCWPGHKPPCCGGYCQRRF